MIPDMAFENMQAQFDAPNIYSGFALKERETSVIMMKVVPCDKFQSRLHKS